MKERLIELHRERKYKLEALLSSLQSSIKNGYDFGGPNASLFAGLLQIEAAIRKLEYWESKS